MNLPINGRIAIIDNEINEVEPLMRVLAKNQLPYVFYKGDDKKYLPDEDSRYNDIRLLFLDINLLNSKTPTNREVKSMLYGVIKSVISVSNFPYSLIYWSKQENEYSDIVKELFENELKDRAPINLSSFVKSEFFPNFGDEEQENDIDLIEEINKIIYSEPSYSYLLNWENQVHKATDQTLQEVFSSYHKFTNWSDNANYLINTLGISYAGNQHYKTANPEEKIKFAFQAFNSIQQDTIEIITSTEKIENPSELLSDIKKVDKSSISSINKKLLLSDNNIEFNYPGSIIEDNSKENVKNFNIVLSKIISSNTIKHEIKLANTEISEEELDKNIKGRQKEIRDAIRVQWKKVHCFVTPLCDFVQKNNHVFDRVVSGILISHTERQYIDDKHEAIFVSPNFEFDNQIYFLVLDFRCFHTYSYSQSDKLRPLFRIKQQLLSEVQSKLARHISRQGVLFLDER